MNSIRNTYMTLESDLYQNVEGTPFDTVDIIQTNQPLIEQLNVVEFLSSNEGQSWLIGQSLTHPQIAQAYAGHQFGHFTMLGDGRAMLIGEVESESGLFDVQLKGSGPTAFSRNGDGKATLQSMAREYLISEAMHHLGVPTTRSLALMKTNESIVRTKPHQGAMLARVASSHLRVGTFEFARALDDLDILKQLADYTMNRHFAYIKQEDNPYLAMFQEVVKRQAKLIATWQSLGFVHGVMNTDNMAISGETIDYGPCAFLDEYDPQAVFSSIDTARRYAYFRQPYIGSWNLSRLAMAVLPLIDTDVNQGVESLNKVLSQFEQWYQEEYRRLFGKKIGLTHATIEDDSLIQDLLTLMTRSEADFTNTFVSLSKLDENNLPFTMIEWTLWRDRWYQRLAEDGTLEQAKERMQQVNPVVIPRNHLVEEAVNAYDFDDDSTLFDTLLRLYQHPYDYETSIDEKYRQGNPSTKRFVSYCGT